VLWAVAVLVFFQLLFTYLPAAQFLFGTAGINPMQWLKVIAVASSVLFLVEIEKAVVRFALRRREAVRR